MTQDEAIHKIISKPKFYIGVMPQSTASNFVISWKKGMVKQKTIESFLQTFGYVLDKPATYKEI